MKTPTRSVISLSLLFCLSAFSARADWSGTILCAIPGYGMTAVADAIGKIEVKNDGRDYSAETKLEVRVYEVKRKKDKEVLDQKDHDTVKLSGGISQTEGTWMAILRPENTSFIRTVELDLSDNHGFSLVTTEKNDAYKMECLVRRD